MQFKLFPAVLSFKAVASGHFENNQETVIMYLLPCEVVGSGPIRSTPIISQKLDPLLQWDKFSSELVKFSKAEMHVM